MLQKNEVSALKMDISSTMNSYCADLIIFLRLLLGSGQVRLFCGLKAKGLGTIALSYSGGTVDVTLCHDTSK